MKNDTIVDRQEDRSEEKIVFGILYPSLLKPHQFAD